jgi:hypothetical protein
LVTTQICKEDGVSYGVGTGWVVVHAKRGNNEK